MRTIVVLDERFVGMREDFPPTLDLTLARVIDGDLGKLEAPDATVRAVITAGNIAFPDSLLALPNLGLVALIGSGFEAVDLAAMNARGIAVTHGVGMNADDVATHAVALFLAHNRMLLANDRRVRLGEFRDREANGAIRSVAGLNVGILGLGMIGQAIALRLAGFGCRIAWWGPRAKPDQPLPRRESLEDLATWSDVLIVAARADGANERLADRRIMDAVGPMGLIVNIARGSIIDEDALIAALREGRLGGAALDVFAQEPTPGERWQDVPNVLLSPHSAASGDASRRSMALGAAENVRRFLAGEALLSPVPGSAAGTRAS